ncbi:MAG: type II toxin-antitoxin system RelE/ParE family toxin [Burkholderiales bacterium]|nr:type II toxin-antitoxin system RelE/ParE family toxin [Burkholderiales bacterium]
MNYWLHPEAQEDLREAAEFYRDQAGTALSQSFLSEFEHSVSLLLQYPRLGVVWRHGKRRLVTRRFPFSVIYAVVDDQIRILAVAHHSRRPGYWRGRK